MKKLFFSLFILALLFFVKSDPSMAQTGCTISLPTNTGQVIMTAEIQKSGIYRVWSRIKAADSTNNSFYVQIDNNCPVLVGNAPITADRWTWVDYQNGNTTQKIDVNLSAGEHIVKLIGNEDGVGVDKLLMTQDLKCVPINTSGDNCPAVVTPIPTAGAPDNTPPTISNIRAEEVTSTSVKLRWELNEFATGQAEYGTTTSYGTFTKKETSFNYDYHIQSLTGLTAGTTYHYRIISTDQSGNTSTSDDCTFTTGASAIQICNSTPPATATPTNKPTSTPTPTVKLTNTPIPTPGQNTTTLNLTSVKLHGIGLGGDNSNAQAQGNTNPQRKTRDIVIELFDADGKALPVVNGKINYNASSGVFTGSTALTENINSGNYLIKVKSPQFLKKQVPGIINIVQGQVNNIPTVSLTTGDLDNNNALTILDYNILVDCYSDLLPAKNCEDTAKKASSDITDDGNVNAQDYNLFLRELSVASGD